MSLVENVVEAQRMVEALWERAREDGVTPQEYVMQHGKQQPYSNENFYIANMELMTFYTTRLWTNRDGPATGQVVMVLGKYDSAEVGHVNENIKIVGGWAGHEVGWVFLIVQNQRPTFHFTSLKDGWGSYEGATYQIPVRPDYGYRYINWTEDPFKEVKL